MVEFVERSWKNGSGVVPNTPGADSLTGAELHSGSRKTQHPLHMTRSTLATLDFPKRRSRVVDERQAQRARVGLVGWRHPEESPAAA
jgi:hypothetical protein